MSYTELNPSALFSRFERAVSVAINEGYPAFIDGVPVAMELKALTLEILNRLKQVPHNKGSRKLIVKHE